MAGGQQTIAVAIAGDAAPLKKSLDQSTDYLGKFGNSLATMAKAAGVAFAAAAAGAIAFGASSLKAASDSEAISRGLENAIKNAGVFGSTAADVQKVTAALDEHSTKLAEVTGIDDELFNQLKTRWLATPGLVALGTDGVNKLAEVTANVAAGTGKDVESIANMFIKTAGDQETALGKLTKAGVVLTDQQKKTYESMVANGDEIGAQTYLIDQLGEKYKGAAEAAANPFDRLKVIFENLQETVGKAMLPAIEKVVPLVADFVTKLTASPAFAAFLDLLTMTFQQLVDTLTPLMPILMDLLLSLLPPIMQLISALAPVVGALIAAFIPLVDAVLPLLVDLIMSLLPIFLELTEKLIIPLIPIITMLIEAFMPLIEAVLPILMELLDALMPILLVVAQIFSAGLTIAIGIFAGTLERLLPAVKFVTDGIAAVFGWLAQNIKHVLNFIIGGVEGFINMLADAINGAIDPLNMLLDGVAALTGGAIDINIEKVGKVSLPRLANGGIIPPRPGGTLATIGEAGQAEAVIPLDKLDKMIGSGSSGTTVIINGNVGYSPEELAAQISRRARQAQALAGINGMIAVA